MVAGTGVDEMTLLHRTCQFITDGKKCGRPSVFSDENKHSSYCRSHWAICYRPYERRKDNAA